MLLLLACGTESTLVRPERPDARPPGSRPDVGDTGAFDTGGPNDHQQQPKVPEFGDDPALVVIADSGDALSVPRDLEYRPGTGDLWVINRSFDGIVVLRGADTSDSPSATRLTESSTEHFMEEPSSLAFADSSFFGSCQESRNTYNGGYAPNDFMGPSLWHADKFGQGWGSTHMDMLHESPLCMGIAHDRANVYWVFDGYNDALVYYDFRNDHGPGNDDHSDGVIRVYSDARVKRVADVPSHMQLDGKWLYAADTGNGRVIRLDTDSGSKSRNLNSAEWVSEYSEYTGATVQVVVNGLDRPSGLVIAKGRLFVADYATGRIHAFDLEGNELDSIQADKGIMGMDVGPDGRIVYVVGDANKVVRVDP